MANEQNLKPFTSETGRANQPKSVEARKQNTEERKAFREYMDELLNEVGGTYKGEPATRKKLLAIKWLKYVTEDDADLAEGKEFTQIVKEIRDTIGEKPSDKVELSIDDESAREIDEYFAERYNTPVGE